jgi:hypothetical protein
LPRWDQGWVPTFLSKKFLHDNCGAGHDIGTIARIPSSVEEPTITSNPSFCKLRDLELSAEEAALTAAALAVSGMILVALHCSATQGISFTYVAVSLSPGAVLHGALGRLSSLTENDGRIVLGSG